jgi:NAD(P)-dependent dehydrogenase (short-subunit alcohol dehydrogenase family)
MNLSGKVLVVIGSDGALGRAVTVVSGQAAQVIAFLVSEEVRAVTGALIPVRGRV